MDTFAFEAIKEVFSNSVVIRIALAGHALGDAKINETLAEGAGSVLDAAVRVENQASLGTAAVHSHVESGKGKISVNTVRESIANDLLGTQIFNNGEIEPAFIGGNIGDQRADAG